MRTTYKLEQNWLFGECTLNGEDLPTVSRWEKVSVPHVWNIDNPSQEAPRAYKYELNLETPDVDHQYFISFNAVAGVCRAWLNGKLLGEHRGGYACFRFNLNCAAQNGMNELIVLADNTRYDDIIPLGGDFNNYGGIYREVELILTGRTHFDLMYHGTSGVAIEVNPDGSVALESRLAGSLEGSTIQYTISDGNGICAQTSCLATTAETRLSVDRPRLWQGVSDPFLYTLNAKLRINDECADEVSFQFGFRSIQITPDRGFFLNGEHLLINGVCKHQDREGCACAPSQEELEEDMRLIREIGANAVRLSHYQHPRHMYDLCDREGLVVWAEIPMLGMPEGNEALLDNARQQLTELILQSKHHPSICFWGIQNEIAMLGEYFDMYRKTSSLNQLAKQLDSSRITVSANLYCVKNNSPLNHITEMVGYNQYYGWYYGEMDEFGPFFDQFHADNPQVPLGISEYGVDCSVTLHSADPRRKDYSEEFQCLFHETVYPAIRCRNFLWGSFIWNMFDFGSANRNEGGIKGRNCKGLVTFDRAIKKDAFYYYKAWWTQEPLVYIAGRRFAKRCGNVTTVKVYANVDQITLSVNSKTIATKQGGHVFIFENVPLVMGDNAISATGGGKSDEIVLIRVEQPENSYIYIDPNPGFNVANWFTLGQDQEDLFPVDRYSIMDEMAVLSKNEKVWSLLEHEIPQITRDPRSKMAQTMTLLNIINRISGQFEESYIIDLNRKLNAISKASSVM